mgnify:CR=1 FL=1
MPIPKPEKNEDEKKFASRCMSDPVMIKEYPDIKQRYAICIGQTKASLMEKAIAWLMAKMK